MVSDTASELQSERTPDALQSKEIRHHPDERPIYHNIVVAFQKAIEEEDLDIYQVCAWVSRQEQISFASKTSYYIKALFCWAIQSLGLMIFLSVQLDPLWNDQETVLCQMKGWNAGLYMTEVQILATMFAFYISLKTGGAIFDVGQHGLYTINFWTTKDCPPFVSRYWVLFGGYTNVFTCLTSIVGSYLVLYYSEDMLDVILNSVALFFVNDVDDFMLNKRDYRRIDEWFEEWKGKDKGHSDDTQIMNAISGFVVGKILTPMAVAATFFTVIISAVAPFWIAVCH